MSPVVMLVVLMLVSMWSRFQHAAVLFVLVLVVHVLAMRILSDWRAVRRLWEVTVWIRGMPVTFLSSLEKLQAIYVYVSCCTLWSYEHAFRLTSCSHVFDGLSVAFHFTLVLSVAMHHHRRMAARIFVEDEEWKHFAVR